MPDTSFLDSFFTRSTEGGLYGLTGGGNPFANATNEKGRPISEQTAYNQARDAGNLPGTPLWQVNRRYSFGDLGTPQLFASFLRDAVGVGGPIEGAYRARVGGAIEGGYGAFAETMRAAYDSARASGVPDYIAKQQVNLARPAYQAQIAQGIYGAEAQRQEDIFGVTAATTQNIANAAYFQAGLDLQKYSVKRAERQAQLGFERGLLNSAIGSATQLATAGILS